MIAIADELGPGTAEPVGFRPAFEPSRTRAAEGEEGAPKKKKEKVQKEYVGPWAGWEGESLEMVAPTQEEWEEQEEGGGAPLNKKARSKVIVDAGKKEVGFGEEKSVFHGAFLVVRSKSVV